MQRVNFKTVRWTVFEEGDGEPSAYGRRFGRKRSLKQTLNPLNLNAHEYSKDSLGGSSFYNRLIRFALACNLIGEKFLGWVVFLQPAYSLRSSLVFGRR